MSLHFFRAIKLAIGASVLLASHRGIALELAGPFTEHMVLQRRMAVPVWGWAAAAEVVTVEIDGQKKSATADALGKWMVRLDPMEAGPPRVLKVAGKDEVLELQDVLLGEVWLASGQSNMGWSLADSKDGEKEVAQANWPELRVFNLARNGDSVRAVRGPAARLPSASAAGKLSPVSWQGCTPEVARDHLSAVAYYFARDLQASLQVPVGILSTPIGGSAIEMWISRATFEADADFAAVPRYYDRLVDYAKTPEGQAEAAKLSSAYEERQAALKAQGKYLLWPTHLSVPEQRDEFTSVWFNTLINPLVPFAMRGVIWYQGEANAYWKGQSDYPLDYRGLFPLLIHDWRSRWGEGDFPFLFVQLPNWAHPQAEPSDGGGWPLIREAQLQALQIPHTGMAVSIDVGDAESIHPLDKLPVGRRLALAARAVAYGEKLVSSGPTYRAMKVEGSSIRLFFDQIGSGLDSGGEDLKRFAMAGEDRKFVWAKAIIEGATVIVSSPAVPHPTAVRYAWETNPEGCNLRNKEGLPASPFRTDLSPTENAACYQRMLREPPTLQSRL